MFREGEQNPCLMVRKKNKRKVVGLNMFGKKPTHEAKLLLLIFFITERRKEKDLKKKKPFWIVV